MAPKRTKPAAPPQAQQQQQEQATGFSIPQALRKFGKAASLFALAALASTASQFSLAPVYGSIPSSFNHREALAASFTLAYVARYLAGRNTRFVERYLPLWTTVLLVLQYLPFQYSESLGLVAGPIITGILGCHLVVVPIAHVGAAALEDYFSFDAYFSFDSWPRPVALAVQGLVAHAYFDATDKYLASRLPDLMMLWPHLNPFNLQVAIALALALILPQRSTLFLAVVLVANLCALVSPYGSGPYSTPLLEATLDSHEWTLLARQWSNTGYLSVLQNNAAGYRVMRCDHSLLGGEWQLNPERRKEGWKVNESIYAVFQMLEAVRLVEQPDPVPDVDARALVIGLGIGTAPKAFLAHGIDTTIVELDPKVHSLATQFFGLPANHTAHLTNAVSWVAERALAQTKQPQEAQPKYDYILHDVFTGGAEPLPLFTTTFLSNLRSLLTPNGVAALNYAGDLSLPLTARILNTIDRAFDGQCALYRDSPASPPSTSSSPNSSQEPQEDFSNFVVFCRNSPGPITFRTPTRADFLDSYSRKSHLWPRPDHEVSFPLRELERADEVLEDDDVGMWRAQQEESARRHWRIMRTVVPASVWEVY